MIGKTNERSFWLLASFRLSHSPTTEGCSFAKASPKAKNPRSALSAIFLKPLKANTAALACSSYLLLNGGENAFAHFAQWPSPFDRGSLENRRAKPCLPARGGCAPADPPQPQAGRIARGTTPGH